jgi:hypothetical protein
MRGTHVKCPDKKLVVHACKRMSLWQHVKAKSQTLALVVAVHHQDAEMMSSKYCEEIHQVE